MESVSLKATPRKDTGKGASRRMRTSGKVPGITYGGKGESVALELERSAVQDILLSERGSNSIIELEVEGDAGYQVMVQDFTVHPVSRQLLHVDLLRLDPTKEILVKVPFRTVGKSKGEKIGGTLLTNVRLLRVMSMPGSIPVSIDHDVSDLEFEDVVKVKDLKLPEGIRTLEPPERKILVIKPPRVATAEEVAEDAGTTVDAAAAAATEEAPAPDAS